MLFLSLSLLFHALFLLLNASSHFFLISAFSLLVLFSPATLKLFNAIKRIEPKLKMLVPKFQHEDDFLSRLTLSAICIRKSQTL
jgi:hypothetical protein